MAANSLPVSTLSSLNKTEHILQTARSNEGTGDAEDHNLLALGHVVPNDQEHLVDVHLTQLHEILENPLQYVQRPVSNPGSFCMHPSTYAWI